MAQPTISVKNSLGNTVTIYSNNPNGQALMADSSPVVIASNQSAIPVTVSGVATAALQGTGNTSIASVDTKLTSTNSSLSSLDGKATTGNASLASIDGKLGGPGQGTMAQSLPVVLASNQSSIPVTVSGVATAANQTSGNASLTSIDGKLKAAGAATSANSSPVVIATDQAAVAVNPNAQGIGALTAVPAGSTNGTPLGTPPAGTKGFRIYLPAATSVTGTIATSQPGGAPTLTITLTPGTHGPFYDEPINGTNFYITAIVGAPLFRWI